MQPDDGSKKGFQLLTDGGEPPSLTGEACVHAEIEGHRTPLWTRRPLRAGALSGSRHAGTIDPVGACRFA
jgi:hypothetical protein